MALLFDMLRCLNSRSCSRRLRIIKAANNSVVEL